MLVQIDPVTGWFIGDPIPITVDGELFDPVPGRQVEISADHTIKFVRA